MVVCIIMTLILMAYCVDIFVIYFFQSRVSILEAVSIWSNWSSWFARTIRVWIAIFFLIWIISFVIAQKIRVPWSNKGKAMTILFSASSIFYAMFYIILNLFGVSIDYVDNILSLNLQRINFENQNTESKKLYSDYIFNVQWNGKKLNIILVFAESLSAIDSKNSGWNDNMPWFDKIQKEWIMYSNFITNWTTSDTAHISTLFGVVPLINIWANNTPYTGYKLLMQLLPEYFNSQWYRTTFISAASLNFLDQRSFLSWAWFQTIIGEEAFKGNKMYAFESAPDWDLYDKVLQEVQNQTWKYFIWLQTISFHKPYNTPGGKTELDALKYSDDELLRFYENLKKIWFFDDGILVIVWDHRKMNPAEEWERELFGSNRYTRSVATVVWSWISPWTINDNIIQHTDFYNSLKVLVGTWPVQIDKTYNDVFSDKYNRNWWITNAEFYEVNRYTVSSIDAESFLFKNLSNLQVKNNEVYDYFSSYLWFEFGNEGINSEEDDDGIKLIWHRWYIEDSPENTLESFLSAKKKWVAWIEFDVSYTKDKQNIVVHWNELYASNCWKLKVWNYTFDWISKNCTIVNGEKYKTLSEMLELIDGLFDYYFLEIKVYDEKIWVQQTLDAIQTVKDLNMQDRVIFISYSDAARETLNADPDIIFGWDAYDIKDLDYIWENNSKYFLAPYDLLTTQSVQKAKDIWKEVVTYTVNDVESYQAMKDLWIKIIMTDKLDILQEYEKISVEKYEKAPIQLNFKKSSKINSEDLAE